MLEKIAARITGNGNLVLLGYVLAAVAFGFLVALIVKRKSKSELQRVPFFVFLSIVAVAVWAMSFVWLWGLKAMASDLLWIVVFVNFATYPIAGYVSGALVAARSRDAFGTGLLAFIPLLIAGYVSRTLIAAGPQYDFGTSLLVFLPLIPIFWLFFQPSRNGEAANRITAIPVPKGVPGVFLGIVLLLVFGALFATRSMQTDLSIKWALAHPDPVQNMKFLLRARGLKQTLKLVAESGNQRLPLRVNKVLRVATLVAEGTHLVQTFMIDQDDVKVPPDLRKNRETAICSVAWLRTLMGEGATIEEVYKKYDGTLIVRIAVTQGTCDKLGK